MKVIVAIGVLVILSGCGGGDSSLPNAVALSPDGVRHIAHSYSPDGKRIAWFSPATDSSGNWQLWVANADMSAPVKLPVTTLFSGNQAIWSPDGSRLAALSNAFGIANVVVVPAAGGDVQRVTQGAGVQFPLVWYADGDRLCYFATAEGGTFQNFVVSVRTGVNTPLVPGEKRPNLGAPSPDGSHIAYFVIDGPKTTIWVADSGGGNARQLTTEGFEALEQANEWSPDGKELLYESRRTGTADLWITPIDGGKPRQLTHDIRNDFGGAWSRDGKWVAFISDRGRQIDIWVVPAGGGVEQRVTDSPVEERSLMWRPRTNELSFVTKAEKSGVWALDVADGKERRLTPDSIRTGWFNVSPDGKQVLFVIERGGGIQDLAVVPLAGGAFRVLVAGGGTVGSPFWSPDGSKIVFASDRGGTSDVWVEDAAGGAPRQLLNWPGSESSPVWDADGSEISFVSDRDTKFGDVWRVAASGGEPIRVTRIGIAFGLTARAGVADLIVQTLNPIGGQISISRVRPDGSVQAVWDSTNAFAGAISPSGDSLSASVEQAGGKMVSMILPLGGGTGRVVLTPNEHIGLWSKDGKSLLYDVSVGGANDFGILNVADGTTRRLTTTPESESGEEFTPDGKTVVFRRTETVERIFAADLTKLLDGTH